MVKLSGLEINQMRSEGGEVLVAPRLQSYIFWRDVFHGKIQEYKWIANDLASYRFPGTIQHFLNAQAEAYEEYAGYCLYCNDNRYHALGTTTYIYCLCELLRLMPDLDTVVRKYGSSRDYSALIDGLRPYGTVAQMHDIADVKSKLKGWLEYPYKWIIISGPTGTGKSHVLQSIANEWQPFALYVVASEMENWFRSSLRENTLDKTIDVFKFHPILLIDDVGIEWATPWLVSVLEDIVEWRSRAPNWHDLITVFSTNKKPGELSSYFMRDGVSKIGSRLRNIKMVNYLPMNFSDFRTEDARW